jgi:hypothetical protein
MGKVKLSWLPQNPSSGLCVAHQGAHRAPHWKPPPSDSRVACTKEETQEVKIQKHLQLWARDNLMQIRSYERTEGRIL